METKEIRPVKITLPSDLKTLKIYVLSDAHIGSSECSITELKKIVNFIKDTPECYCILLGDILNTALKNSKSDIYSETMCVADTQKLAIALLDPIKDKILGMVAGNHENRVWREVGFDISHWIADKLDITDRYWANGIALSIRFGSDFGARPYTLNIFGQHGAYGGGRKMGSAANALEDLDGIVANADIYIRAHTHQPIQGSRRVFTFNDKGNLDSHTKYYFNAPSVCKYAGYGYEKGYKPTDNSPCFLNIRPECYRNGTRLERTFKIDKIML